MLFCRISGQKQEILNIFNVRFWHKADAVQANVRYERQVDITNLMLS